MNRAFILIDFDNVFKRNLADYTLTQFELIFKNIIRNVLKINPLADELQIRLYGGWFKEEILSSKASTLQQMISSISLFPIIKDNKRTIGNIQLATTLHSLPTYVWTNTYKEKKGIPRLRIKHERLPDWCSQNRNGCPAFLLNKFTTNKEKRCHIEHCEVTNAEVFTGIEQKMVDTLISCDIISISNERDVAAICLFSDDIDLLPAIGFSSILKKEKNSLLQLQLFIKNEYQVDLIEQILKPFEVKIFSHEQE